MTKSNLEDFFNRVDQLSEEVRTASLAAVHVLEKDARYYPADRKAAAELVVKLSELPLESAPANVTTHESKAVENLNHSVLPAPLTPKTAA